MPNYIQVTELGKYYPSKRIIELAQGDSETETLSALEPETLARIEARIVNAEAEADAYLQGRFDLPISNPPARLKLAVGKIAIYYLYEDRPELWTPGNPMQDQYDIHREWLEAVKESELFMGSEDLPGSETDIATTVDDTDGGMIFAGGGLSDY